MIAITTRSSINVNPLCALTGQRAAGRESFAWMSRRCACRVVHGVRIVGMAFITTYRWAADRACSCRYLQAFSDGLEAADGRPRRLPAPGRDGRPATELAGLPRSRNGTIRSPLADRRVAIGALGSNAALRRKLRWSAGSASHLECRPKTRSPDLRSATCPPLSTRSEGPCRCG